MKVKIREIKLKNNQIGVLLDKHYDGGRKQQRIGITYADIPRNAVEREFKKQQKELVKKIVAKMVLDNNYDNFAIARDYKTREDFFVYCEEFIQRKTTISDVRSYRAVVNKLKGWTGKEKLACGEITEDMLSQFRDVLTKDLNGISAYNYFKKLRRIFKEATIARYFKKNPAEAIFNQKGKCAEKDVLSVEEIKRLADAPCRNHIVKNAFLFCCFTGIRHCDTITLKWSNIVDGCLDIVQLKTKERVIVKLNESALSLMGSKKDGDQLVFNLPTHTGCLKILKQWAIDANVEKHITWHVSRHSFASALLNQSVDIFTVSKLLGHKTILQTQTYLRIAESKKEDAVNKLPSIL